MYKYCFIPQCHLYLWDSSMVLHGRVCPFSLLYNMSIYCGNMPYKHIHCTLDKHLEFFFSLGFLQIILLWTFWYIPCGTLMSIGYVLLNGIAELQGCWRFIFSKWCQFSKAFEYTEAPIYYIWSSHFSISSKYLFLFVLFIYKMLACLTSM